MTKIVVRQLIFDKFNLEHIKKHGVTPWETQVAGKKIIYHKRTYKGRYLIIGRSGKRLIAMVLKRLDIGKYYLITARDAGKKERRIVYEKENK